MNEIEKKDSLNEVGEYYFMGYYIKIYGDAENPLFMAKDVANWIQHSNSRVMLQNVDEDEKDVRIVYTLGGPQEVWMLTEDGLYEVLMQSRKPIAKLFKKQVKGILRQIRRNGSYNPQELSYQQKMDIAILLAQSKTTIAVEEIMRLFYDTVKVRSGKPNKDDNISVFRYLNDIEEWEIKDQPIQSVYEDYEAFCKDHRLDTLEQRSFIDEVKKQTGLTYGCKSIDGIRHRRFFYKD